MGKTMRKVTVLLLFAVMLLAMTACGGKKEADVPKDQVGKYMLEEVKSEKTTITQKMLQDLGMDDSYLELRSDGTATLYISGDDPEDLTWSDGKLTADGESIAYTYSDGMITIKIENEQMTFKKA